MFVAWLLALVVWLVALIPQETPTVVPPTATATLAPAPTATPGPVLGIEALICEPDWPCSQALAIAWCESRYDPSATGALGEQGIFQLRPEYHAWRANGGSLYDARTNIAAAYSLWLDAGWQPWSCSRGFY